MHEDDHNIDSWIKKKTDKYTSPEMQNEILKVMAHHILRQVVESLKTASTIMVDETTDVSNKEQVVVCFRWVDSNLESHEEFVGLYVTETIQSSMLVQIIHDILQRFGIPITKDESNQEGMTIV